MVLKKSEDFGVNLFVIRTEKREIMRLVAIFFFHAMFNTQPCKIMNLIMFNSCVMIIKTGKVHHSKQCLVK